MRKLIYGETLSELVLPKDLLWADEFNWQSVASDEKYALSGELHIQEGTKKKGRFITLEAPDDEMAWATREVVELLSDLSNVADRKYVLVLGSGLNEKRFTVAFRHAEQAVEAHPVYRWQEETGRNTFYKLTLRFIEV